jgi:hypothetical protein
MPNGGKKNRLLGMNTPTPAELAAALQALHALLDKINLLIAAGVEL